MQEFSLEIGLTKEKITCHGVCIATPLLFNLVRMIVNIQPHVIINRPQSGGNKRGRCFFEEPVQKIQFLTFVESVFS